MLEPIRQIEILLKADWSDWNSNASAITDKRFGEAEEESHTVNWVESQMEVVRHSGCETELSIWDLN